MHPSESSRPELQSASPAPHCSPLSQAGLCCADYPPDSSERKAELSRLLAQGAEAPAEPPRSLAPLVPAAQGPSSPLRLGKGSGKGLLGGRRVMPGPPPKRVGLKRSPSWSRSSDSGKTWAVEALPRGCPDGCCLGFSRDE